ncbi:HAD family hydrolase [Streptomyces sp. NPDC057136]|uniref:HAD family hydrolase n=1 Tax=Streptomyces sp. NPDC057136 TaxID=3346029 RepID=UPI00362FFD98
MGVELAPGAGVGVRARVGRGSPVRRRQLTVLPVTAVPFLVTSASDASGTTAGFTVPIEVVALLKRARKAVTVALVSNATTRLDSDLARQGLDVLADAVVNTAHIGVAKPDPRVYLIAAE